MRAAPAVQLVVQPDAAWHRFLIVLAAVSCSALMAGLVAAAAAPDVAGRWCWALLAVGALLPLCRPWQRHAPVQLRWDGLVWHAGPVGPAGSEPWSGQLTVAIDLGGWMLLHLQAPSSLAAASLPAWIAISRHSQLAAWHPLRCAVYSPRPQRAPDAMEPGPAPHERP